MPPQKSYYIITDMLNGGRLNVYTCDKNLKLDVVLA
jgi:hypothetical protein